MTATITETKTITVLKALNEALDEAMAQDSRVFLLGEDLAAPSGGISGVTKGLTDKYGKDRVLNTPISEAAIAGAAIGAALEGQLPVAEIMIMDFIGIAMDNIVNLAAKARFMSAGRTTCPVTIRTASFAGAGSGATHSQSLEAWFTHIPGLKVIAPSTPADTKGLLKAAIFDPDPCIFLETTATHRVKGEVPVGTDHIVEIGKGDIKRPGSDVTIITYGRGVFDALTAAEELAAEGIAAEVLDLRTLMPLDMDLVLASVRRTKRAVVAHYATEFSGPGAELAAQIGQHLFGELEAPVARVGARYRPIPSRTLEKEVYPTVERIGAAVRAVLEYKK